VASLSIVEHLDLLKDGEFGLRMALIGLSVHALGFERAKEAHYHGIIVAVTFAAHAHLDMKLS